MLLKRACRQMFASCKGLGTLFCVVAVADSGQGPASCAGSASSTAAAAAAVNPIGERDSELILAEQVCAM
jgi:hypothetical protein